MPEFKDDFQNSFNTLPNYQRCLLSRNTEKIKTMVMVKQRVNTMEPFHFSGDEVENYYSYCSFETKISENGCLKLETEMKKTYSPLR